MRIKLSKLGIPDTEYMQVLKGEPVILRLYHKPQFCVSISRACDTQVYPLSYEQYLAYHNYAGYIKQDSSMLEQQIKHAQNKAQNSRGYISRFWENVAKCYENRLNGGL